MRMTEGPTGGELEPVMKDGKRADPVFAVRTVSKLDGQRLVPPGGDRGKRVLLAPDGKGYYAGEAKEDGRNQPGQGVVRVDLETGARTPVKDVVKFPPPQPGARGYGDELGSHGGTCLGIDGFIYTSHHGGCGQYPMQLVWFNPERGEPGELYSSFWGRGSRGAFTREDHGIAGRCWDGPADAQYLLATSTKYQMQCPRTGAIMNCGWDDAALRRYQDGFVTSVLDATGERHPPRPGAGWIGKDVPNPGSNTTMGGVAPNGDLYAPDGFAPRIVRYYRTDWPKEQPEYGYGEKFMPKARLEELMLEYAKKYIANYSELSKIY
jgi:hypothetical protein